MVSIKITGLKRVQTNLRKLPTAINMKGNQYFMANQTRFTDKAKEIVKKVVYDVYTPKKYQRT